MVARNVPNVHMHREKLLPQASINTLMAYVREFCARLSHDRHRVLSGSLLKLLPLCLAAVDICDERPNGICGDCCLVADVESTVAGDVNDDQLVALRLGEAANLADDTSVGSQKEAKRHGINALARFDVVLLSYLLHSCSRALVGSDGDHALL